jgi:hypothetical protein
MGDRVAVIIRIGGPLPRSLIPALVEACEADCARMDWGGGVASALTEQAVLDLKGEQLELYAAEVNYAELDNLEPFLVEHGLLYRIEWEAGGGFSAGGKVYDLICKIGGHGAVEYEISGLGEDTSITAAEIRKLGDYESVLARLDRLDGPLPPLEVVDG